MVVDYGGPDIRGRALSDKKEEGPSELDALLARLEAKQGVIAPTDPLSELDGILAELESKQQQQTTGAAPRPTLRPAKIGVALPSGAPTPGAPEGMPHTERWIAEQKALDARGRQSYKPPPPNVEAMQAINAIRKPAIEKAEKDADTVRFLEARRIGRLQEGLPLGASKEEEAAFDRATAKPTSPGVEGYPTPPSTTKATLSRIPEGQERYKDPGAWARFSQPWKDAVKMPQNLAAKLILIDPMIQEAIELELGFRQLRGLYDPDEAPTRAGAGNLRRSISRELELGLPMYHEEAARLQGTAYELMAEFGPKHFPRAQGFWNTLASSAGNITVLITELALMRKAGLNKLAKAAAPGAPAVAGAAGMGVGFGISAVARGEDFKEAAVRGALLGSVGSLGRAAAGPLGAGGAVSAYMTGRTLAEGGTGWEAIINGILVPLAFHGKEMSPVVARGLSKAPAAADRVLGKAIEAVQAGRDGAAEARLLIQGLTDGTLSLSPKGRKLWRDLRKPVTDQQRLAIEAGERTMPQRSVFEPAVEARGEEAMREAGLTPVPSTVKARSKHGQAVSEQLPPPPAAEAQPPRGPTVTPPRELQVPIKELADVLRTTPKEPSDALLTRPDAEAVPRAEETGRLAPGGEPPGVGRGEERPPPAEGPPKEAAPVEPPQVPVGKEVTEPNFGLSLNEVREVNERFPIGEANPFEPIGSDLKPPREGFDTDLMAATKQIQATARYDALRRTKALGMFSANEVLRQQKIETKDVRWTITLAHELGHAIHFSLAGKEYKAFRDLPIKKTLPDLTITEKEAQAELVTAAEIVRPLANFKWTDTKKSHVKYRLKSTELMADLFALYAHDVARARKVAPNVTAAFETEISRNPKLAAILDTVMNPLPVELPKVGLGAGEARTPTDLGDKIVGSQDDPGARAIVDELRTYTTREMDVAAFRVNREALAWEKLLPKEKDRQDVGALVEGIGNLKTGESYESIKARMTPAMEKVLREYQHKHELARQEVNKLAEEHAGEKNMIRFLEDHLPHYYKHPKKIRQFASKWTTRTPHTKKRVLPTLAEAVEAGLEPITQDVAYLHRKSAELNYKAALTRGFVQRLKKLTHGITGEPLVVASQDNAGPDWVRIEHPTMRKIFASNSAYVHPAIARSVQVLLDAPFTGSWARGLTAISATGKMLNVAWSGFHAFTLGESAGATLGKATNPMRGFAIGANESRKLGFGFKPLRTWKAGHKIAEADPLGVEDAIRHGLTLTRQASADYFRTDIERGLKRVEDFVTKYPGMGLQYLPKAARRSFEMINKQLWDNLHAGWKLLSYHQIAAEELARAPGGMSPKQVKETVAKHINNAFGGQEAIKRPVARRDPEGKLRIGMEAATPKEMQILRWMLFAPDWTYSNIAVAGQPVFNKTKLGRKLGRRYWRNMGLQMTVGLNLTQRSLYELAQLQGDDDYKEYAYQNEPGRRWDLDVTPIKRAMPWHDPEDKRRYYARPFKQAKEVWGWMEEPRLLLTRKLGFVPRIVLQQLTGQQGDWLEPWHPKSWEHVEGWAALMARGKALGEQFVPFSWQENNFAFVLPLRKGMTPYRGARYFRQAIEAHVNPGWFKRATSDIPRFQKALVDVVKEVRDAMKASGASDKDIKKTYQTAKGMLRAEYRDKMWRAIDQQDGDEMRKWAEKVGQLGGTRKTLKQSEKRRGRKLPPGIFESVRIGGYKALPSDLSFRGL